MKLKNIIAFTILLQLMFSGCEDLLTENPKDFIAPQNFYKTVDDAEKAINGAYEAAQIGTGHYSRHNLMTHHAEYTIPRGSYTSMVNWENPIASDQYSRIGQNWHKYYSTINRSNEVILKVTEMENIDESTRSRILAEAHFLRAWSYWDLVRMWGAVPIRLEPFTGSSEVGSPRMPIADVYALILSDLEIAEQGLPETAGTATGKASKMAAKIVLANLHLAMENWGAAAQKADEIITSGHYSLVTVQDEDDFYQVFGSQTPSSEEIMAFHASQNNPHIWIRNYHGTGTVYVQGPTSGITHLVDVDVPLIQNWDENDLRKEFNMYDRFIDSEGNLVLNDENSKWRFKKRIADPVFLTNILPIWRLAEAYLIYAEAANMAEGGPSEVALERLNSIRRRAYGLDPHTPNAEVDLAAGMSQSEFRDRVILERAYELFFEYNNRWWDLRRTGKMFETFQAAGKNLNPARELFPIPQQEIDNNPLINQNDQNPGY